MFAVFFDFFFSQVLVEHAGRWKTDEDPLPLLEVYTVAILSFAKAASCLSSDCENVPLLLEKLSLWVKKHGTLIFMGDKRLLCYLCNREMAHFYF